MNNRDYIENLIAKQLAGEITMQEEQQLALWMEEDDANRKYYASLKAIYDKAADAGGNIDVDTDAAWMKVKNKIDNV